MHGPHLSPQPDREKGQPSAIDVRQRARRVFRFALIAFAAWATTLAAALAVEGTGFGRTFFHQKVAVASYLAVQLATFTIALALFVMVLLKGTNRQRLVIALPALLLVIYGAILAGGPG